MTIVKDASGLGLGLSIIGGQDTSPHPSHRHVRIKSLVPGGAAERTGRLVEGDVLTHVDGDDVQDYTHQVCK